MPYKDPNSAAAKLSAAERSRRWRDKHPEVWQTSRDKRYAANRDELCAKSRKYYWDHRDAVLEKAKTRNQCRLYGVSEHILEMLGTCCAICYSKFGNSKGHRLHVDHNAETGVVRGRLCSMCNRGIGSFKHNPELLRRAAQYLDPTPV